MSGRPSRGWTLLVSRVLATAGGVAVLLVGTSVSTSVTSPLGQRQPVREVEESCHRQLLLEQLLSDAEQVREEESDGDDDE